MQDKYCPTTLKTALAQKREQLEGSGSIADETQGVLNRTNRRAYADALSTTKACYLLYLFDLPSPINTNPLPRSPKSWVD